MEARRHALDQPAELASPPPAAAPGPPRSPAGAAARAAASSAEAAARAASGALAFLRGSSALGGGGGALGGGVGAANHAAGGPARPAAAAEAPAARQASGGATGALAEQAAALEAEMAAWALRPRRSGGAAGRPEAGPAAGPGSAAGDAGAGAAAAGGCPLTPAREAGPGSEHALAGGRAAREPPSCSPNGRPVSHAVDCAPSLPASPAPGEALPRLVLGAPRRSARESHSFAVPARLAAVAREHAGGSAAGAGAGQADVRPTATYTPAVADRAPWLSHMRVTACSTFELNHFTRDRGGPRAGMLPAGADEAGAPADAGYAAGDDEAPVLPPKRKLLLQGGPPGGLGAGIAAARGGGPASSSPRVCAAWM